ncbi:unnamed protein product [Ostreobium quekettii]|uniref:Protein kinase domain-containing protein n=1 Tax=Ostreobium quekettii TaxID=121088 RepID=A0A8S1J1T5_9CHLO|nr:unnamed protein product [Ostreobium quekettii]|eukprot:evm.model.scf_795.4 EVM.evm.TU.scf_795.4   scf_795:37549-52700(-)
MPMRDRLKCAIFECFLLLAPVAHSSLDGWAQWLIPLLDGEILDRLSGSPQRPLGDQVLAFGIAAVLELQQLPPGTKAVSWASKDKVGMGSTVHGVGAVARDPFLSSARARLDSWVRVRRPDDNVFAMISSLLLLLITYMEASPSNHPSLAIMTQLEGTLNSIAGMLQRAGQLAFWGAPLFHALASLLKLYETALGRLAHQGIGMCAAQHVMQQVWLLDLVEMYAHVALAPGDVANFTQKFSHGERRQLQCGIWRFLTSVARCFGNVQPGNGTNAAHSKSTSSTSCNNGDGLARLSFAFAKYNGLGICVLSDPEAADFSDGTSFCLHAEVLHFFAACMAVPGCPMVEDSGYFLQLHCARFRQLYELGEQSTGTKALARLHLEVVVSALHNHRRETLFKFLSLKMPQYLVQEIARLGHLQRAGSHDQQQWLKADQWYQRRPWPNIPEPTESDHDSEPTSEDTTTPRTPFIELVNSPPLPPDVASSLTLHGGRNDMTPLPNRPANPVGRDGCIPGFYGKGILCNEVPPFEDAAGCQRLGSADDAQLGKVRWMESDCQPLRQVSVGEGLESQGSAPPALEGVSTEGAECNVEAVLVLSNDSAIVPSVAIRQNLDANCVPSSQDEGENNRHCQRPGGLGSVDRSYASPCRAPMAIGESLGEDCVPGPKEDDWRNRSATALLSGSDSSGGEEASIADGAGAGAEAGADPLDDAAGLCLSTTPHTVDDSREESFDLAAMEREVLAGTVKSSGTVNDTNANDDVQPTDKYAGYEFKIPPTFKYSGDLNEDARNLEILEEMDRREWSIQHGIEPVPLLSEVSPTGSEFGDASESESSCDDLHPDGHEAEMKRGRPPVPSLNLWGMEKSNGALESGEGASGTGHAQPSLPSDAVMVRSDPSAGSSSLGPSRHPLHGDVRLQMVVVQVLLDFLLLVEAKQDVLGEEERAELQQLLADVGLHLYRYINHPANEEAADGLKAHRLQYRPSSWRLMCLLRCSLFDASLYGRKTRIHKGDKSQVHRCQLGGGLCPQDCVVKVLDFPSDPSQHVPLLDIFSEVSILEELRGQARFPHLYDYGVCSDSAFISMKSYKCSLEIWRKRLPLSCPWAISLFLRIFHETAKAVQQLHNQQIVHFDIKCSNVLLDPVPGVSEAEFWAPKYDRLPFGVILADFGEARCYKGKDVDWTVRNRGTEYNKAPEMLRIAEAQKREGPEFDRRETHGAGAAGDVWALGCMLFELVTSKSLQYDKNWAKFYSRVTGCRGDISDGGGAMGVIGEDKASLLPAGCRRQVLQLLDFMLVREQRCRPTAASVVARVEALLADGSLPPFSPCPDGPLPDEDAPEGDTPNLSLPRLDGWRLNNQPTRLAWDSLLVSLACARDPWALRSAGVSRLVLAARGRTWDAREVLMACARAGVECVVVDAGEYDGIGAWDSVGPDLARREEGLWEGAPGGCVALTGDRGCSVALTRLALRAVCRAGASSLHEAVLGLNRLA